MQISTNSICNDLLAIQLSNGVLDLSWAIDTDTLKQQLIENKITKIYDFQNKINFIIQIDTVNTFDSINLKEYTFSNLSQIYRGNIVYSAILDFNKNKFEETQYYFRVKLSSSETNYTVDYNGLKQIIQDISFFDSWSESYQFIIRKDYTKDLIESMYNLVADFNAYNKEAKSANMYYIFQAIATNLDSEFDYILKEKNKALINKSLPDTLVEAFGILFKFGDSYGISMEEYRRILRKLIIAYQHGGAWNYIKEVIKYLIGCTPELIDLKNFYTWILRKTEVIGYETDGTPIYNWVRKDPDDSDETPEENFKKRNYYNPESNFYLFKYNEVYDGNNNYYTNANLDKNLIMLLSKNIQNFTFIVKTDNFFNVDIDKNKVKSILNLLKSAYTKYTLNIYDYEDITSYNYLYVDNENNYLLVQSKDEDIKEIYLQY